VRGPAEVVQQVVAVEAAAQAPHLHQPRPDRSGWYIDRDGPSAPKLGMGQKVVTRQCRGHLRGCRAPSQVPRPKQRRHDEQRQIHGHHADLMQQLDSGRPSPSRSRQRCHSRALPWSAHSTNQAWQRLASVTTTSAAPPAQRRPRAPLTDRTEGPDRRSVAAAAFPRVHTTLDQHPSTAGSADVVLTRQHRHQHPDLPPTPTGSRRQRPSPGQLSGMRLS